MKSSIVQDVKILVKKRPVGGRLVVRDVYTYEYQRNNERDSEQSLQTYDYPSKPIPVMKRITTRPFSPVYFVFVTWTYAGQNSK